MVEPAGRYASCLRSPPVVERRPLNAFQMDADHSNLNGRRRSRICLPPLAPHLVGSAAADLSKLPFLAGPWLIEHTAARAHRVGDLTENWAE